MKLSKALAGRAKLIAILTGCAIFAALLFYFNLKSLRVSDSAPPIENTVILSEQEQTSSGFPARLKIPTINVDATVESVGLTPSGDMDVSKDPNDVAWYELGTRPGENGSAVMAGHYGTWKNGKGSVFDNLHKLSKGDKLYIEDEKGVTSTFVVREIRNYDPQADAVEVFSSNDEKSHLNLITCEGAWNKVSKSYPERRVVFADKE